MTYAPIFGAPAVEGRPLQMAYQHRWVLVDAQGRVQTPDTQPSLNWSGLQVQQRFGDLSLSAPGMLRLDIPMEVLEDDESAFQTIYWGQTPYLAVDEGDLVAHWLGIWLKAPYRLFKIIGNATPVA